MISLCASDFLANMRWSLNFQVIHSNLKLYCVLQFIHPLSQTWQKSVIFFSFSSKACQMNHLIERHIFLLGTFSFLELMSQKLCFVLVLYLFGVIIKRYVHLPCWSMTQLIRKIDILPSFRWANGIVGFLCDLVCNVLWCRHHERLIWCQPFRIKGLAEIVSYSDKSAYIWPCYPVLYWCKIAHWLSISSHCLRKCGLLLMCSHCGQYFYLQQSDSCARMGKSWGIQYHFVKLKLWEDCYPFLLWMILYSE